MKIIIDETAGCCAGVQRAIKMAEAELETSKKLISLGPLIHNRLEVERLKSKGLAIIDQQTVEDGKVNDYLSRDTKLLVRTHGIPRKLKEKLLSVSAQVIDATCPRVRRSQKILEKYDQEGYQIIIVGKKNHPEVVGLMGHCNGVAKVVLNKEELNGIDITKKTLLLAQTTVPRNSFLAIQEVLKDKIADLVIYDTTCQLINRRHQGMSDFAKKHDVILFVGGKDSSNTKILFDICLSNNKNSYLIESPEEIDFNWLNGYESVGISGSASTPRWQLEKVRDFIKG